MKFLNLCVSHFESATIGLNLRSAGYGTLTQAGVELLQASVLILLLCTFGSP